MLTRKRFRFGNQSDSPSVAGEASNIIDEVSDGGGGGGGSYFELDEGVKNAEESPELISC